MQSSPPVRAWDRPSSPAKSQYSLDLGALGLDSQSNESSPVAKPRVDRVLSEDIDGPSDFTLNMAAWMRGGTMGKGTVRSAQSGLQSLKEQEARIADEERKHDERLEVPQSPEQVEEEHTTSHHTPDHSPPKDSPWHEQPPRPGELEEDRQEHDSSDWDPYAPSGTPQPPAQKLFLQPTVEDYHSELTPARLPSVSARAPSLRIVTNTAPHSEPQSPQESQPGTLGRPSSETLSPVRSPVRSPVMQRSQPAQISSPFTEPEAHRKLERQMQQFQARCRQLENLNSALKKALDEEQRIRKQEKAVHDRQLSDAGRREKDLVEMKEEAQKRAEGFRQEFGEQKESARRLQEGSERQRQDAEDAERRHEDEVGKLRDELETQHEKSDEEMQQIKLDLELARRRGEEAEESARLRREELEGYRDSEAAEMEQLRREVQTARSSIAALEDQLKSAKAEADSLREKLGKAEEATSAARNELAATRNDHDEQTTCLTDDNRRATRQVEDLQTQVKDLQQQLRDEQKSHDDEIDRLAGAHEQALAAARTTVDAARGEVEAKQGLLNEAILERDAAQDSLAELQAARTATASEIDGLRLELETAKTDLKTARGEIDILREQLKDSDAVNAALDARISDAMCKRDAQWRSKLEESERERQVMAKALLHQWGREELGIENPQAYAYKLLVRSSPKKDVVS